MISPLATRMNDLLGKRHNLRLPLPAGGQAGAGTWPSVAQGTRVRGLIPGEILRSSSAVTKRSGRGFSKESLRKGSGKGTALARAPTSIHPVRTHSNFT
jgi:hypothetical protein